MKLPNEICMWAKLNFSNNGKNNINITTRNNTEFQSK